LKEKEKFKESFKNTRKKREMKIKDKV